MDIQNPAEDSMSMSDRRDAARKVLAEWDDTAETYRDGLGHGLADALRSLVDGIDGVGIDQQISSMVMHAVRAGVQAAADPTTVEQRLNDLGLSYVLSSTSGDGHPTYFVRPQHVSASGA